MSYPRHSVIWRDCEEKKWWLDIVRSIDDDAYTSKYADTIGAFDSKEEAIEFLDNYANIGYETPVLDPDIFQFLSYPESHLNKEWEEERSWKRLVL